MHTGLPMKTLTTLLLLSFLAACASAPVDSTKSDSYFNTHSELTKSLPTTKEVVSAGQKIQFIMSDFKTTLTEENLRATYADNIYFNDTFATLNGIDELVKYLGNTVNMMEGAQVSVLDVAKSDSDYYVRWEMDMEFYAKSKKIKSKSIGVSQLRFNAEGKIIYHQDYWDSANAFYQHLPIVGGLVKRVRDGMH